MKTGLTTATTAAPVVSEGDEFLPLRLLRMRYEAKASIIARVLNATEEHPVVKFYLQAAKNISLLIPSRFEALANEA